MMILAKSYRFIFILLGIWVLIVPGLVLAQNNEEECPEEDEIHRYITVPMDYDHPEEGTFELYYELAEPFDPTRQTLIFITDAQQFYITPYRAKEILSSKVDGDYNLVGIMSRGKDCSEIEGAVDENGTVDYARAYRYYSARQFVEDIDMVRRELVGPDGGVLLYGESGGGLMLHQYVQKYGQYVIRAYSQSAAMPQIDQQLQIESDRFFDELYEYDSSAIKKLREIFKLGKVNRFYMMHALQRMNFFVDNTQINVQRVRLINEVYNNNLEYFDSLHTEYQCKLVNEFRKTPVGAAIGVRLYELYHLFLMEKYDQLFGYDMFYPDIEAMMPVIEPYHKMFLAGQAEPPKYVDSAKLARYKFEIFILGAYHDHAVSCQSQQILASYYPNSFLFIADDNHMFSQNEAGYLKMRSKFLEGGLDSPLFKEAVAECERNRRR